MTSDVTPGTCTFHFAQEKLLPRGGAVEPHSQGVATYKGRYTVTSLNFAEVVCSRSALPTPRGSDRVATTLPTTRSLDVHLIYPYISRTGHSAPWPAPVASS
ncbi:hypothetical protein LshimejAT787_0102850 [Lyophyllum shimeji]|uniref:Uncharacterized protein n=1 Tax=Lyophyllum shimeji TaxID=47721 RepID=A0A9P3UJJ4_LYOSH|nr:hypothetical protein LshimejAT787_0102850 [Lyophyllum shimeji]